MYLRQPNKWNEFLLQEAIENTGLPPAAVTFIRRLNVNEGPIAEKHLTWLGNLMKPVGNDMFLPRLAVSEIARQLKQSVRTTLEKRDDFNPEAFGELYAEALAPLLNFKMSREAESPTLIDIKNFKKSMLKNLRKLKIDPPFIRGFDSYVDNAIRVGMRTWEPYLVPIIRLLAEDPLSYDDLRQQRGVHAAGEAAKEMLDNPPKDPGKVIHEFPNGHFWYDIQSHHCDFEGKRMGHCGRGEQGQLYSLRTGTKRRVKPLVTLEFDGSTVYQIKGKANEAPHKDLWPYIDWFIENMGVERILETGQHSGDHMQFDEMLEYLEEKHPDVKFKDAWVAEATELLEQWESSIETDSQTFLEIEWPGAPDDAGSAGVGLRHQAFWPVKDIIVDEDTHRLRWEIRQDAQSIADDTLYPNPRIRTAEVFARGVQDSETAMLRIEMVWEGDFAPQDEDDEEGIKEELQNLESFLEDLTNISGWLTSPNAAPDDAEFDYNDFHEKVQKKLEAYGVYRDIAGEIDAEDERDRKQMELPLQEQRIIQRWSKIIK